MTPLRLTTPLEEAQRQAEVFFEGWTLWHLLLLLIPFVVWGVSEWWDLRRRR